MFTPMILINTECRCKKPNYGYNPNDMTFYCKSCGQTIRDLKIEWKVGPFSTGKFNLESFIINLERKTYEYRKQINECEERIESLESELEEKEKHIKYLEEEKRMFMDSNQALKSEISNQMGISLRNRGENNRSIKKLTEKLVLTEKQLSDSKEQNEKLIQEYNDLCATVNNLNQTYKETQERDAKLTNDLEVKEKEILSWKKDYAEKNNDNKALKEEIQDLNNTNKHLRVENEELSKIDTRAIVGMFLEYLTSAYNASLDCQSIEVMKERIEARTEWLKMNAEGLGLKITNHERMESLKDSAVEIQTIQTDDQEKNGKVSKTDCFGCTFDSPRINNIPESVTVYLYTEEKKAESEDMKSKKI